MRMRRRLNAKLLLILIVATAVTSGAVHGVHIIQLRRSAKGLVARAARAEQKKDLPKAAEELGRYLVYEPKDEKVLVKYADLLERIAGTPEQWGRLMQVYNRVIRETTDPKVELAQRRRLADVALALGDYSTARSQLEVLKRGGSGGGEVLDLLGQCEEAAGEADKAIEDYRGALKADPSLVGAYERLATLLRGRRQDREADELMGVGKGTKDDLIARNGKSATAYLARALYRRRYNVEPEKAADDLARALELAPDDAAVLQAASRVALDAARVARAAGQADESKAEIDRARDYLRRGVATQPKEVARAQADAEAANAAGDLDRAHEARRHAAQQQRRVPALYQALADVEQIAGRPEEAVAVLTKGIAALPEGSSERVGLQWSLADQLINLGRADEADKVVAELKGQKALRPEFLTYLEGHLRMARRDWSGAIALLDEAQAALATRVEQEAKALAKQALVFMGECYRQLGDTERRHNAYSRAVALTPNPDPLQDVARLGLAAAAAERGGAGLDEAIQQYQFVSRRAGRTTPEVGLGLARLQIAREQRRAAAGQKADWTEAESLLTALEKAEPGTTEVALLRADVAAAQGQPARARELLEKARDAHPEQARPWIALAVLDVRTGQPDAVPAVFEEARKHVRDRAELMALRQALVAYWARRGGGVAAATALAALEKEAEGLPDADRTTLLRELAAAYLLLNQDATSARLWRRLDEQLRGDLQARLSLFDLAYRSADKDAPAQAERALEAIQKLEDDPKTTAEVEGSYWRYDRARLLLRGARQATPEARKESLAEARRLLEKVAIPGLRARAEVAAAQADELEGDVVEALNKYQRAILERGERDPEVIKRTVQLLNQRQLFAQAALVFQKLRDENRPLSDDLRRLAADVAFFNKGYDQALDLAKSVVSEDSKDYRELMWIGQKRWAAETQGSSKESAEPLLRRAVELAPQAPEARLLLVAYLAATNRKDQAQAEVKAAEGALPKEVAPLTLARCYAAIGEVDQAQKLYKSALEARPDDPAVMREVATYFAQSGAAAEAEPILNRITARGTEEDKAWARRTLLLVVATSGNRQRAREMLKGMEATKSTSPQDLLARARALALQPSRDQRRQAIGLLEDLNGRKLIAPGDVLLLSGLYEAVGDWPKSRQYLLRLLEGPGGQNPTLLATYASALLRHGQPKEAAAYVSRLESVAPKQTATIALKAQVLHAQGQDKEAVELLRALVREDGRLAVSAAALLEKLGQFDAADEMYQAAAQAGPPEAALARAEFLGRRGKTAPALELVEANWAKAPADRVISSYVLILYNAMGDDKAHERVAQRLEREVAGAKPDEKPVYELGLANVLILQKRYAEAEKIYRKYGERDKGRSSALNNLAWVLALQGGGREAEALSLVERAIEIEGEVPEMLDTRAVVLMAQGQHDRAVQDLITAISQRPDSADMYFHLAGAYLAAGRRDEAAEAFRKATKELGLKLDTIHPLERPAFERLQREFAPK